LIARACRLAEAPRTMGQARTHLTLRLDTAAGPLRAVWWNGAATSIPPGTIDVIGSLERNIFGGRNEIRMNVRAIRPTP
jgi:hypothetical protein